MSKLLPIIIMVATVGLVAASFAPTLHITLTKFMLMSGLVGVTS